MQKSFSKSSSLSVNKTNFLIQVFKTFVDENLPWPNLEFYSIYANSHQVSEMPPFAAETKGNNKIVSNIIIARKVIFILLKDL